MSDQRSHPHFNDRGAHDWATTWSAASAEAKSAGKRVLLELGREL